MIGGPNDPANPSFDSGTDPGSRGPGRSVPPPESGEGRLVVVSNRLPLSMERDSDGWSVESSSGGLVTALTPVLRQRGGLWIGWPGVVGEDDSIQSALREESEGGDFEIRPVCLAAGERDDFYYGFSNEIAWPLFHGFVARCNFRQRYWECYREINRRFARAVAEHSRPEDVVWIHDYHLMSVADALAETGVRRRTAFYLHIPFPHPEVLKALPWRDQLLRSLLRFDRLGFQTERDRLNFLECVEELILVRSGEGSDRETLVGAARTARERTDVIPVSIDPLEFVGAEGSDEIRSHMAVAGQGDDDLKVYLGVDRLDYSKGIPHKLRGFRRALQRFPELRGRVTLVQLVVPSRESIPEYRQLKEEIERLVGEINGAFTRGGWVPIHYLYRSWGRDELLAHYRAADVALVTPLRDGMNLVAKEFVVASDRDRGVLVLSEFAGAAEGLREGALLVNPYDEEGVAEAVREAFRMDGEERARRLRLLRERVWEVNAFEWMDRVLDSLSDVPVPSSEGAERAIRRRRPRSPLERGRRTDRPGAGRLPPAGPAELPPPGLSERNGEAGIQPGA